MDYNILSSIWSCHPASGDENIGVITYLNDKNDIIMEDNVLLNI